MAYVSFLIDFVLSFFSCYFFISFVRSIGICVWLCLCVSLVREFVIALFSCLSFGMYLIEFGRHVYMYVVRSVFM